jgi:hypothetical protein
MFLWTSFLYLFQTYQFRDVKEDDLMKQNMEHTFIIENVLALYHLGFLPTSTIFYMNPYGYIVTEGPYVMYQNNLTISITIEGETIYVISKN